MSYVTPSIRMDESGMWVLRKYHEAEIERLREALERVAEYDGEWVEEDPLLIRDYARNVLGGQG